MKQSIYAAAHDRAFSVAAAIPEQTMQEACLLIGQMVSEGVSFDEARTALQRLLAPVVEGLKEPA